MCNPFLPAPGLLQSGSRKSLDFPFVWEVEVEEKIDTRSWPQKDPEEIRKSDRSFELLKFYYKERHEACLNFLLHNHSNGKVAHCLQTPHDF